MSQAKLGDRVKVHYTGKLEDGSVFDSSDGRDPLEFTLGDGRIIPGFEQAVVGMAPGEVKTEIIDPENAYGPYQDEMVQQVEREALPTDLELEIGRQLQVSRPDGPSLILTITDIDDATVTLDANHPLAGKPLTFQIELVEIVAA